MSVLWIVAPVFNEEKSLRSFVTEWIPVFRRAAEKDFVFCVINDGSTDRSLEIMRGLAKVHPELKILDKANTGHGPSCLLGYRKAVEAGADWIFQVDSDRQCDPSDFEAIWQARLDGRAHYGYRKGRKDGFGRCLISRLLSVVVFLMTFRWIKDPNVPYRLIGRNALRSALKTIPADSRPANILLSLVHIEDPGIEWHRVRFRKRPGRQIPLRIGFFIKEAWRLLADYLLWIIRRSTTDPMQAVLRLGKLLVGLGAAYYLIVFLALAVLRTGIFAEYGWIESVHLVQVHRFLEGLPLYSAPSLEYVPLLYGPLYEYVSAVFALLFGEAYAILRIVSMAATLGTLLMIWLLVRRMGAPQSTAWVAMGLYAAMDRVSGFAYAAGRLDSLFVFFTIVMAYQLWRAHEKGGMSAVYAALAAVAAVLTKQTALVPVFALSFWNLVFGSRRGRIAGCPTVASVILS